MRIVAFLLATSLLMPIAWSESKQSDADHGTNNSGLVHLKSTRDVAATMDRLIQILNDQNMTVFARIDHAEGAKKTDQTLRPTQVLIFGNPKVGTPLMQCQQSVAIDLPQKALVWEDAEGHVWLSYNDPAYLAKRHEIQACEAVLEKVSKALGNFAKAATQAEKSE